ncbi:hypothetical protein PIROE2DRAFT_18518 [Piromyces sp. E2]|nr:hypothetical protein PIROE2DRAFT_18518 [Piromyces sp. E2]|eukprot:OUM56742.1 hypothetical protein PIROE2DRAFT_18518 [Piromyces sp. E2]
MAIGRFFVQKTYNSQKKEYAEKTLEYVRQAMINRIPKMEWLEKETIEYALKKVSAITEEVGGPDYIFSSEKISSKYDKLDFVYDNYFDNILIYNQYKVRTNLKNLGKEVDVAEILETSPQTINAFYTPHINRIYIPAGILQPPFFNSEIPNYLNFGSIGTVIGHELTHAFDSTGKDYDIDGKLNNWWVDNDLEEYEDASECFIERYDKYKYKDNEGEEHFVNGSKSLDENLADNGGLSRAYEAWQLSLKEDQSEKYNQKLPGLTKYTNEQLFFISFGQIWCANYYNDYGTIRKLTTDEHSPENARVNESVSNSPYFAKAFKCSNKAKMNPKKKCTIW